MTEDTRTNTRRRARLVFVLVAVFALGGVGCAGSSNLTPKASAPKSAASGVVTIKNIAYNPAQITIRAGETVTWRFDDAPTPHTVTANDHSFDSGTMTTGQFSRRFDTPGTYSYMCLVHPTQMTGTVVVS
jgi:plastocyanin